MENRGIGDRNLYWIPVKMQLFLNKREIFIFLNSNSWMGLNSKFLLPSKIDFQKKIFELSKISQDFDSIIRNDLESKLPTLNFAYIPR